MSLSNQWLCGRAEAVITGIRPVAFLNGCTAHNIPFEYPTPVDECTLRLYLPNRLTDDAAAIASRCGCTMEILRRTGGQRVMHKLRRRLFLWLGGIGVMLAAAFVLVFQGGIVLIAQAAAPFLTDYVIGEMTCVGSILIMALGMNIIGVTNFKVMNYLPAIFLPILLCTFM